MMMMASKQPPSSRAHHSTGESLSTPGATPEKLHLPNDLYGLFVAEPLQLDASVDGWAIVILAMTRAFFFIALNFAIQMLYVVRIHRLSVEMQGEQCRHEHSYMQVVCVFVFGVSIFRELRDCMDFVALVVRCPVSREGGYVGMGSSRGPDGSHYRHGAVLSSQGSSGAVLSQERASGASRILSWARRREAPISKEGGPHAWSLDSMRRSWKVACLLFVGLPRVFVCSLFAKVGAGFIVRSPEEDIIIDTVAVLFVVDVGTFMYNAFTTNAVKQQLEQMKPVEWQPSNAHRLMAFLYVNFAYPVLLICFSITVVWYSRNACGEGEDFQSSLSLGEHAAVSDLMEVADFFREMVSLSS